MWTDKPVFFSRVRSSARVPRCGARVHVPVSRVHRRARGGGGELGPHRHGATHGAADPPHPAHHEPGGNRCHEMVRPSVQKTLVPGHQGSEGRFQEVSRYFRLGQNQEI